MPQSKGTATWLTNVKQDAPMERIRLDNSRARIENKRIDHEHGQQVDMIWMQHHRNKADLKYEIKRAKEEAERWRRMRSHLERNRVHSAIDKKRKERQSLKQRTEGASYAIVGPDGEVLHRNSPEYSYNARHTGLSIGSTSVGGSAIISSGLSQNGRKVSAGIGSGTVGSRNSRTLKSPLLSSYSEEDDDNGDDNDYVFETYSRSASLASHYLSSQGKQGCPKSASAMVHLRPRSSFSRSVSSEHSGDESLIGASGKPGRSFQELKDLSHIDRITDNMKASKRAEILKIREMHQAQEYARLQKRIETFYVDVETLKRKLTPIQKDIDKLKPLKIASWS